MASVIQRGNRFGFIKNGEFRQCTNFVFDLKYSVDTDLPGGPGYLLEITRAVDGKKGYVFILDHLTIES